MNLNCSKNSLLAGLCSVFLLGARFARHVCSKGQCSTAR